MSELLGLAFLLCSRAAEMGLKREDLLFLVECQFDHLESVEGLRRLDSLFWGGGVQNELGAGNRNRHGRQ